MGISFNKRLERICNQKKSRLCIGLDINPDLFTKQYSKMIDSMEKFGKDVIDSTIEFCPVYKPNFAFYERFGAEGYRVLESLVDYIDGRSIVIADAKRGDIGNTSKQYAEGVFNHMGCDAITVSAYMGRDVIEPFLKNKEKGVFVLSITSNPTSAEIQNNKSDITPLYQRVIEIASQLNLNNNIGLVVGGTQNKLMKSIRKMDCNLPWLIPGIGAQGGDLFEAVKISNLNGLGIINISRSILYAGNGSIDDIVKTAKKYNNNIWDIVCNQKAY